MTLPGDKSASGQTRKTPAPDQKKIIGWREWVGLPDLGIDNIKAKIDTGARTSTMDAEGYELIEEDGIILARFQVTFGNRNKLKAKVCRARVVENRKVTNSGGQVEERIVILSHIKIGPLIKEIEITLTQRKNMKFRMLLGRTAISEDFLVDAARSYLTGRKQKRADN
ncbi:ATP-dependent zinc protease [Candidatus Spongiihabitans sp.]|uniref:ATP-dependent zinc protease family protein n=1 Tax=Candidatus Spongiihabitans sp. TaxID=3101308 RepID=UPI003C7D6AFA